MYQVLSTTLLLVQKPLNNTTTMTEGIERSIRTRKRGDPVKPHGQSMLPRLLHVLR